MLRREARRLALRDASAQRERPPGDARYVVLREAQASLRGTRSRLTERGQVMVGRPPKENPGTGVGGAHLWEAVVGALCMGGSFLIGMWFLFRALEAGMWR